MTDPLDVLDIKEPCTEPWERMAGDERTRHCERCQLSVHNLSAMTREEARALLRGAETPCVRFIRRADGTVLTRDCTPLRSPSAEPLASVPAEEIPASGIPRVDLGVIRAEPEALRALPAAVAQRFSVLPLRWGDGVLVLAVAGPPPRAVLDDVRWLTDARLELALAGEQELREAIERAYVEDAEPVLMGEADLDDFGDAVDIDEFDDSQT